MKIMVITGIILISFFTGMISYGFVLKRKKAQYLEDKKVAQVAVIVRDIEQSARAYAEVLGMEVPPVVKAGESDRRPTTYMGKQTDASCLLAFFNMDNIQIELIQPLGEKSTWNEFLEEKGEGLHHIAFWVDGIREHVAEFENNGMKEVQYGGWDGGEYSYVDAGEKLGIVIELLENYNKK